MKNKIVSLTESFGYYFYKVWKLFTENFLLFALTFLVIGLFVFNLLSGNFNPSPYKQYTHVSTEGIMEVEGEYLLYIYSDNDCLPCETVEEKLFPVLEQQKYRVLLYNLDEMIEGRTRTTFELAPLPDSLQQGDWDMTINDGKSEIENIIVYGAPMALIIEDGAVKSSVIGVESLYNFLHSLDQNNPENSS
jgi:hypothetical protein